MAIDLLFEAFQQGFQLEQTIHNLQAQQAQEATLHQVAVTDNTILSQLGQLSFNLGQQIPELRSLLSQILQAIQQANPNANPVTLQQVPVRLPPVAPPGYGGAPSGDIADAVWGTALPNARPFTTLESVDTIMGHFYLLANNGATYPINGNPGYAIGGADIENAANFSGPSEPFLDFHTILPTDATIFAWATRVYPTVPWTHGPNGTVFERDTANITVLWWIDLSELQFREWKTPATGGSAIVPPVWPGIGGVTLGTPVAISSAFQVTGPMAGVIVNLTAVNPKKTTFDVNGHLSHRNIGELVFVDDHGEAETFQPLRFNREVFCPKTMTVAASCQFSCDPDDTGTVTPFTIP